MLERFKFLVLRALPKPMRRQRVFQFFEQEHAGSGEKEIARLGELVEAGDVCLDIGSNMGTYSYHLSKLGAKVIAFEANPEMADFLRGLGIPEVEVRETALSDEAGEATFAIPHGGERHALGSLRGDSVDTGDAKIITVRTKPLDAFDLSDVKFVKIDVEGAEERVLDGAMDTITRERPTLMIEIEERYNRGALERICERLSALGYSAWFLLDQAWQPVERFNAAIHQVADGKAVQYINNFIFLPEGKTFQGTV